MSEAVRSPGDLPDHTDLLVVGGGPAGLAAAYQATRQGRRPLLIEQVTFSEF